MLAAASDLAARQAAEEEEEAAVAVAARPGAASGPGRPSGTTRGVVGPGAGGLAAVTGVSTSSVASALSEDSLG
jgi:hypothetical protein